VCSCFIFYRFQYTTGAARNTTPATGATAFNNADDLVPVFPFSIRVEKHPQENGNPHSYIYGIHFLSFYMVICFLK
jgi:hypothetical protein